MRLKTGFVLQYYFFHCSHVILQLQKQKNKCYSYIYFPFIVSVWKKDTETKINIQWMDITEYY